MRNIFIIGILIVSFSITLKAQDTMYVYQQGGIITKIAVNKIDSIIFYAVTNGGTIEPISKDTVVTDVDGNVYNTVTIGSQVWLAENLKTTKYNDGTPIPLVKDSIEWSNLSTPGYCWYSNDSVSYAQTYGAMYNWYTLETGNLCPTGWRIPSEEDWGKLIEYLGDKAGGKLKETGTTHWKSPNTGATNSSGFTALPGGVRRYDGIFGLIEEYANWWTTYFEDERALVRLVTKDTDVLGNFPLNDNRLLHPIKKLLSLGKKLNEFARLWQLLP